jgi:flagellar motor switch protein FliG
MLQGRFSGSGGMGFLGQLLRDAMGEGPAKDILDEVQDLLFQRDPFMDVRRAELSKLATILAGETPQVTAIILSELPPDKSAKLLEVMDESVRSLAIRGMASGDDTSQETRIRVARVVEEKLAAMGDQPVEDLGGMSRRDQKLRKVAVLIRGLETEDRDAMIASIAEQDPSAVDGVKRMMVLWEDIPVIADRAMQEVLRGVNSKKLALALVGADEDTVAKIRENISERATAMLEEEAQLLSSPSPSEVRSGRDEILSALRDLNQQGELSFVDKAETK